jgi:two-component system nitrogen regulation sensor histidine kinase GlnL
MLAPALASRIVENLTTAVLWFDRQFCLRAINPAGEALLEVSSKRLLGVEAARLFPDAQRFVALLRQALENRRHITEYGMRLNLLPGRIVTVDCSIAPVNEAHRIDELLVELAQADQHLRMDREEKLLLQHQAARNVVRGLAHEIRNPLGGLRGAAQLLARELPEPRLQEYTDIIIGEADRLQALLDRLLGPRVPPRRNMLNIHQVLQRLARLIQSETGGGIEFKCDFDPSIPELMGDADQIHQALLNIARNAVQAMQGKGRIHIRTRVQRKMYLHNRLCRLVLRIDISDNGPGIPEDMLEQIFYPLVTGRPDGSGLGLSIAQTLAQQNGGLISCDSRPGETVFSLWLPLEFASHE